MRHQVIPQDCVGTDVVGLVDNDQRKVERWGGSRSMTLHRWEELDPTMPEKTAKMLRIDLEAVGIPYTTELGRVVDFHFLRNTC